jgi:arylformamidase
MDYIDITYSISEDLPKWPGSHGFKSTFRLEIPESVANASSFHLDTHYGTHLDAPLHFIENGNSVDQLDLNVLMGPAYIVHIERQKKIGSNDLNKAQIPQNCKRLLIKTENQALWKSENKSKFYENFAALTSEGAQWIVDRGIELVGIDYLSIQRFKDGPETHQVLLKNGVVIVEALKLDQVEEGWYELICLPMKLKGLEGAPVRAVLKSISNA